MISPPIKTDEVFPRDKEFPKFQTAWCQTRRGPTTYPRGYDTSLCLCLRASFLSSSTLCFFFFPKTPNKSEKVVGFRYAREEKAFLLFSCLVVELSHDQQPLDSLTIFSYDCQEFYDSSTRSHALNSFKRFEFYTNSV